MGYVTAFDITNMADGYNHHKTGGGTETMTVHMKTDGTWTITNVNGTVTPPKLAGNWRIGTFTASDYEIKYDWNEFNSISGSVTNGAAAFTALSAERTFAFSVTFDFGNGAGELEGDLTITIRKIANPTDLVTHSFHYIGTVT